MADSLKSAQFEKIDFQTELGYFVWWPAWDAFEKHLFPPLREAVAENNDGAVAVRLYFQHFFLTNMQHAVCQMVEELVALAHANGTRDKKERWKIAQAAAETAKQASLARLRGTTYFPKPKRGEKKRPATKEWISRFINEQKLFTIRLENVITTLLKQGTRPTLDNVAALLGMGSKKADTGRRILARQLKKWIDPHKKPGAVLAEVVKQVERDFQPPIK